MRPFLRNEEKVPSWFFVRFVLFVLEMELRTFTLPGRGYATELCPRPPTWFCFPGWSQNTGTQNLLYRTTFRLCIWNINKFCLDLDHFPKISYYVYADIPKFKNNLKSKTLTNKHLIRSTPPILHSAIFLFFSLYME